MYIQAWLQKDNSTKIVWIPANLAKKNIYVKIKESKHESWNHGWKITNLGSMAMQIENILKRGRHDKYYTNENIKQNGNNS